MERSGSAGIIEDFCHIPSRPSPVSLNRDNRAGLLRWEDLARLSPKDYRAQMRYIEKTLGVDLHIQSLTALEQDRTISGGPMVR